LLDANIKVKPDQAINKAAKHGHLTLVEILLQTDSWCDEYAINRAAKNGHIAVVKVLLQAKKTYSVRAIYAAAVYGHANVVDILLKTLDRCTAFEYDIANTVKDAVDIEDAVDIACSRGHLEVVKSFIHAGKNGSTMAMDDAAANGHFDVVKYLFEHKHGFTSDGLDRSAQHKKIFKYLFDKCLTKTTEVPDFNVIDKTDKTAIIDYFARIDHINVVKQLIKWDYRCSTAILEQVVRNCSSEMVYLVVNSTGQTSWRAIEVALELGYNRLTEWLLQKHKNTIENKIYRLKRGS